MEGSSSPKPRYKTLMPVQRELDEVGNGAKEEKASGVDDEAKKLAAQQPNAMKNYNEPKEPAKSEQSKMSDEEAKRAYNNKCMQIQRFIYHQAVFDNSINIYIEQEHGNVDRAQKYVDTLTEVFDNIRREISGEMNQPADT